MRWQTDTSLPEYPFRIGHETNVLLLGSCFTENIGARLTEYKFPVVQNPFGIMYNPISIHQNVATLCGDREYQVNDLEQSGELFFSYDHHSRFSGENSSYVLRTINNTLRDARQHLNETKVVFISLGTSYHWVLQENSGVVNNCHKQPGNLFLQQLASYEQVRSSLTATITLLRERVPGVQIVFTISPVRHLKHGAANNQRSKATLLLAAQELAESVDFVHYFPSYELLMDDLRDYRFYAEDLLHPNSVAIQYIWEKFSAALVDDKSRQLFPEIDKLNKLLAHKPFTESGMAKQLQQIEKRIEVLHGAPFSFTDELAAWKARNL